MSDDRHCECCGAKMVEYRHRLNKGLCGALLKLFQAGGIAQISDLNLSKSQYCNFQKLKYWWLVEKVKHDDESKGGEWRLTNDGFNFIVGLIAMPEVAVSYRGERVRVEGDYKLMGAIHGAYDYKPYYRKTAQALGGLGQTKLFG